MSDQSLLSILHISDFHFTRKKIHDQELVVGALCKDLEALCIGHRRPDVVIFTGDLVHAGGIDSHLDAYDVLLNSVSKSVGCSDDRIFIVPGNHDVHREFVNSRKTDHENWQQFSYGMDEINQDYIDKNFESVSDLKFQSYNELNKFLSESSLVYRNDFASVHRIKILNLDLVVVNTAMLSTGGEKGFQQDAGHLSVPEYALIDAFKRVDKNAYRIVCTHHPLSMLTEQSSKCLREQIDANGDIHLFGHMHDPFSSSTTSIRGSIFTNQGGAIFTHRSKAYIGYSLILVERKTSLYENYLRTYYNERKEFDAAIDIIKEGKFYNSQEAREFWRKVATPIDDKIFRNHLNDFCSKKLIDELELTNGDKNPYDMFVPPPMKYTSVKALDKEDSSKGIRENSITFDEILKSDSNFVLYAPPEFGRTTVLRQLQYKMFVEANECAFPRLPIIIDFSDVKQNVSSVFKAIRARSPELPDGITLEAILQLGQACIMVDDVDFLQKRSFGLLCEFISKYPRPRYIFSSLKNLAAPLGANVVIDAPVRFDFFELCQLRRRDMRILIVNFNSSGDVDDLLDRLQSEFQAINLPFTAANGSILMEIYEEHSGFRPINRSVLIEQFIDATLRKASVEQSRRQTFDYDNKTSLLAHLASWMAQNDNYAPDVEIVRDVIRGYLDRLGLNAPIDELLHEFFYTRIFVKRYDSRLSFRYKSVLEYFISLRIRENKEFREWVFSEENYLQFLNEILYYAGKVRNDLDLLTTVGIRFEILLSEITKDRDAIDLNQISSLQLPTKDADLSIDIMSQQLSAPPLTQEERDEELQADMPRDAGERQDVFRPKLNDISQKFMICLFLYSGLIKNLEEIDNTSKREHLSSVWRAWSIFLHYSLAVVSDLARHRKIRVNGVLYELNAPQGMEDVELARLISLAMPSGISRLIFATLGTEKLERQLNNVGTENIDEPLVIDWLRSALIADLKLPSTTGVLKNSLLKYKDSRFLEEAMIWKISELRRSGRLNEKDFQAIRLPLVEAILKLKNPSKSKREQEKQNQLNRLDKEGLLIKIKGNADRDKSN